MTPRKIRRSSLAGHAGGSCANIVDKLAFKYMMCKVDSSTDSESDISPMWSDTSTMEYANCISASRPVQRRLKASHKTLGRQSLDPYDGSSEDSDELSSTTGIASRRARQQTGGGCRFWSRNKRAMPRHSYGAIREGTNNGTGDSAAAQRHLTDVQMRSGSDPELSVCASDVPSFCTDRRGCGVPAREVSVDPGLHSQPVDSQGRCTLDDSGVHTASSSTPCTSEFLNPVGGNSLQLLGGLSERSLRPCSLKTHYKRKMGQSGMELGQKKRQRVIKMEQGQRDSL